MTAAMFSEGSAIAAPAAAEKVDGDRLALFVAGSGRAAEFCRQNGIPMPVLHRLSSEDRLYRLATCAFYRLTTINIMVGKCARRGYGGRAWSWPGYVIDRTPYGVIAHELGHHVDHWFSMRQGRVFSKTIWEQSQEEPITGYLGTDSRPLTYFMEWFAEIFRLFVTNPDLCRLLRPRFYAAMTASAQPLNSVSWEHELRVVHAAPARIVDQARKKIGGKATASEHQQLPAALPG